MRNYPSIILDADDSISETGLGFFTGQAVSASFTIVCGDASANGTVKIQGSNEIPIGDPLKYVPSIASFVDITNATSAVASGVAPAIVLQSMNFQYIRAIYTSSSGGSTTIRVTMSALGV